MQVKISVVVPTYKRPQLLVKCLEALDRQVFCRDDYEVIVVSDGADGLTESVVENHTGFKHLTYLATPQKKGPAAARNMGWLAAKGVLVAFTDDDCIPDTNWLQTIWQEYKGEELIAYTGKTVVPVSQPPTDYERNIANLEVAEFITANCACSKQALLKVGGFDERFSMAWREDSDLHFKFLKHSIPIKQIAAVIVHPVRKAPWGISLKEQKKGVYNALLYKKYPDLYRQRIKPRPSWNYYAIIVTFLGILTGAWLNMFWLIAVCVVIWLLLTLLFTLKRLANTSKAPEHVLEMLLTSILIPFCSLYWQFYGDLKFRALLL